MKRLFYFVTSRKRPDAPLDSASYSLSFGCLPIPTQAGVHDILHISIQHLHSMIFISISYILNVIIDHMLIKGKLCPSHTGDCLWCWQCDQTSYVERKFQVNWNYSDFDVDLHDQNDDCGENRHFFMAFYFSFADMLLRFTVMCLTRALTLKLR